MTQVIQAGDRTMPVRVLSRLLDRLLICIPALIVGCGPAPIAPPVVSPPSRPVSQIGPIEFFTPEQKRIQEHLDWETGCFKIEYVGPDAMIGSRIEIWKEGKLEPGGGSNSVAAGIGEVSITVRPSGQNYKVVEVLSCGGGKVKSSGEYARPNLGSWSNSIAALRGSTELLPGQDLAVWAIILNKSGKKVTDGGAPIMERVKHSDWAMVLKVVLTPRP